MVLTPAEDSDVDYALSFDTKPGGTAATAGLPDGRPIIAKTGTTNLSQSAFFIGSIPQFTLAVGMFTNEQGCPGNVSRLRGQRPTRRARRRPACRPCTGWPACKATVARNRPRSGTIFAMKEFAQMQVQSFPAPDFGGTAWNLLGPNTPKPKKAHPTRTPTITCQGFFFGRHCHQNQGNGPSPTPTPTLPGTTVTATPTPTIRLPGARR